MKNQKKLINWEPIDRALRQAGANGVNWGEAAEDKERVVEGRWQTGWVSVMDGMRWERPCRTVHFHPGSNLTGVQPIRKAPLALRFQQAMLKLAWPFPNWLVTLLVV